MRKLLLAGALALTLSVPLFCHAISASDIGLSQTGDAALYPTDSESSNLASFIGYFIIQPVLGMVGVIFLFLTIYGGIMWMTAAGNPDQLKKAKAILTQAILGTLIIVLAYALTTFVFNSLTGVNSSYGTATTSSDASTTTAP